MITARSPDPVATRASTEAVAGQRRAVRPRSVMAGWAIRHSPMSTTSCERCARSPATPSGRTANCTRVRQPRPAPGSSSPGSASTVTSRSRPASRLSCWRTTAALSDRWAGSAACCQSQPPQPPGTGVRARGLNTIRRGRQDLYCLGAGQPGCDVGDTGENRFARQRVPDEHDRSIVWPGNAPAAVSHVHRRDLDDLTGLIIHGVAFSHVGAYLWRGAPCSGTRSSWRDGRAHRNHGLRTGRVDAGPHP